MEEDIHELIKKKDGLEAEIKHNLDILQGQKGVGMTGSLVDAEQFPRADIDLSLVRQCRQKVICLQNDHKDIMKQIEVKLHELHADANVPQGATPMEVDGSSTASRLPFARIDQVDQNSPASAAGLEVGDELIQFGSISEANFAGLQSIASVVQHSQGKTLPLLIRRNDAELRLTVTPNTWSGRGLLGCHIVPLKK